MDFTISAVRLWVTDLEVAKQFYTEQIGIPLTKYDAEHGYFILDTGHVNMIVEVENEEEDDDGGISSVGGFKPFSLQVSDIHATYTRLREMGIEFLGEPERQFWGGTLAYFKDPDKNEITLVEY